MTGRKHVVCGTRLVREGSEESSTEDAPKIKAERLEEPHLVSPVGTRKSPRSKITDYFSSPPVLVPEVPLPDHDIKIENDGASDKSEGDSGKENEENNDWSGSRNSIRSTTRALGAKPKQPAKNIQKTTEPNRGTSFYFSCPVTCELYKRTLHRLSPLSSYNSQQSPG